MLGLWILYKTLFGKLDSSNPKALKIEPFIFITGLYNFNSSSSENNRSFNSGITLEKEAEILSNALSPPKIPWVNPVMAILSFVEAKLSNLKGFIILSNVNTGWPTVQWISRAKIQK